MKNNLANASSPYLRQHAHNPIHWQNWEQETLEMAKEQNKVIFLSIGYSACHWCHVMEKESFSNQEVADFLNQHFISIKVDREERPDLDNIYMLALQGLTGQGGWPLNIFLTPEGTPFFGGTYFPESDMAKHPSFFSIITNIERIWRLEKDKIVANGEKLQKYLESHLLQNSAPTPFPLNLLEQSLELINKSYDKENGGHHHSPKFPAPMIGQLYLLSQDNKKLIHTLNAMTLGGLLDHIGGGFHRYCTDERWFLPHFEKMLTDNALLMGLYADSGRQLHNDQWVKIAKDCADFLEREFLISNTAYATALDADSEGTEGTYYLWGKDEIEKILPQSNFCELYNIFENAEKKEFPRGTPPHEWFQGRLPYLLDIPKSYLSKEKSILLKHRLKRQPPFLDNKILTSWNAMTATAFLKTFQATGDSHYQSLAFNILDYLSQNRVRNNVVSTHGERDGQLDDYAYLIQALVFAHQMGKGPSALELAKEICVKAIEIFLTKEGTFSVCPIETDQNITPITNTFDQATPGGNSIMAGNMWRLGYIYQDKNFTQLAQDLFKNYSSNIIKNPFHYAHFTWEWEVFQKTQMEYILINDKKRLKSIYKHLTPWAFIFTEQDTNLPFLQGKDLNSNQLYICERGLCHLPLIGNAIDEYFRTNAK